MSPFQSGPVPYLPLHHGLPFHEGEDVLNELHSLEAQQEDQSYPHPHIPVGLVVLSPSLHLLYQNQHAQYLINLIKGEDVLSPSPLTQAFQEIGEEILRGLRQQAHQPSTQLLEKKWVIIVDTFTILFQGIGVPHYQHTAQSRIIIRFSIRKKEFNK